MRPDQVRRYARHVLLHDVGGTGQQRFLDARARFDEAAGGAAAAALVYLAAAGVGTIVVADAAPVRAEDVGFLYELADVGLPRRQAVRARVQALNPDVTVEDDGPGLPVRPEGDDLLAGARAASGFLRAVLA